MDSHELMLMEAACRRLAVAYGRFIDVYDDEGVVGLFTPDAVWQRPGQPPLVGHDAIRSFLATRDRSTLMRHVMSNFIVTPVDASHARGLSYWTGYVALNHPPQTLAMPQAPFSVGEYHDEYVRGTNGWLISSRSTHYIFRDRPRPTARALPDFRPRSGWRAEMARMMGMK
ncbi:MAG: nuclear transport factor 2 family protein [Burkholderiaceae bacterium]|nr:nuclear transport factor 2 family protein [Burkholderiaceae bacterium]